MQTHLADFIRDTPAGHEANAILRACVHCGFCTATCPTYQLLGNELDGPRGRIYLIKEVLEGAAVTSMTQLHLDRCLSCRSCETTCPSGVRYSRLLDIGRAVVVERVGRGGYPGIKRSLLKRLLLTRWLFAPAYRLGQRLRPILPSALRAMVLPYRAPGAWPSARPSANKRRHMIALAGCVQPTMAPNINAAAARVLDALNISLVEAPQAGCCGALSLHLDDTMAARAAARRNIDAWWPLLEAGAENIVMTASGCGVHVRDYAHLLQEDPDYAKKAARVALLTRDVSEVVAAEKAGLLALLANSQAAMESPKLAFHSPCTLQHGQKIRGAVEELLAACGYELTTVPDSHLCCGSAGSYSVLQPEIATRLRDNKVSALSSGRPATIATANIGCLAHLQSGSALPVRHWIELLDQRLAP